MGLIDTILGRTKPVKANLDALFSLPSAGVTLDSTSSLVPTGIAGVCVSPAASMSFDEAQREFIELLHTDSNRAGELKVESDRYGYRWLILHDAELDDLVTKVHMANTTLAEAGWGPQLLCSVFGFAPTAAGSDSPTTGDADAAGAEMALQLAEVSSIRKPIYIVYLYKRGTFYPFVPTGHERRDNEAELRLRGLLSGDIPIEQDVSRWFPLWDLPLSPQGN